MRRRKKKIRGWKAGSLSLLCVVGTVMASAMVTISLVVGVITIVGYVMQ